MKRFGAYVSVGSVLITLFLFHGSPTQAQSGSASIQTSGQLTLPAASFPSDYKEEANQAWTTVNAESSTFSQMHVRTYTDLGLGGAWYQYYSKYLFASSGQITFVTPVEIAYLGTYYSTAAKASEAFADALSSPSFSNPALCTYGAQCVTQSAEWHYHGVTYTGKVRIIQQGNAVAEIRTDAATLVSAQVSANAFVTNLDGVSGGFSQAVMNAAPTNTPVTPTAVPTSTSTPVPTPSPTLAATSTPTMTPIPLFVIVKVTKKTLKAGSKQTVAVTTLPLAKIDIVVIYPDLEKKRHTGQADGNGGLTWAFKQPAGHSSASKHTARVVVTVRDGTSVPVQSTARYTIR